MKLELAEYTVEMGDCQTIANTSHIYGPIQVKPEEEKDDFSDDDDQKETTGPKRGPLASVVCGLRNTINEKVAKKY